MADDIDWGTDHSRNNRQSWNSDATSNAFGNEYGSPAGYADANEDTTLWAHAEESATQWGSRAWAGNDQRSADPQTPLGRGSQGQGDHNQGGTGQSPNAGRFTQAPSPNPSSNDASQGGGSVLVAKPQRPTALLALVAILTALLLAAVIALLAGRSGHAQDSEAYSGTSSQTNAELSAGGESRFGADSPEQPSSETARSEEAANSETRADGDGNNSGSTSNASKNTTSTQDSEEQAYEQIKSYCESARDFNVRIKLQVDAVQKYGVLKDGDHKLVRLGGRKPVSEVAQGLSNELSAARDEIDNINLQPDSANRQALLDLRVLYQGLASRLDAVVSAWDISLAMADPTSKEAQNAIMAPIDDLETDEETGYVKVFEEFLTDVAHVEDELVDPA